jgi:hypothetical protein
MVGAMSSASACGTPASRRTVAMEASVTYPVAISDSMCDMTFGFAGSAKVIARFHQFSERKHVEKRVE